MKFLLEIVSILRVIRRVGFWQAFILLFRSPKSNKEFLIDIKGFSRPVTIRGSSSDPWVLNQILICHEYAGFIELEPKRILDGGANIGLASLYWSSCFPDAEIVAVEPDPENFRILTKNTEHLANVTPIQGGLWSKETKLHIQSESAEKYAISVVEDECNGTINAYDIPSIMRFQGWDYIDVVKLDVEGAEVSILAENSHLWINKINILIIELHQDIDQRAAKVLFKAFSDQDFFLRWRGENLVLTRLA